MYWLCLRAFDLTLLLTWKSWIANPLNMIMKVFSLMEIKKSYLAKRLLHLTLLRLLLCTLPRSKKLMMQQF